jgi:hypothetical protein
VLAFPCDSRTVRRHDPSCVPCIRGMLPTICWRRRCDGEVAQWRRSTLGTVQLHRFIRENGKQCLNCLSQPRGPVHRSTGVQKVHAALLECLMRLPTANRKYRSQLRYSPRCRSGNLVRSFSRLERKRYCATCSRSDEFLSEECDRRETNGRPGFGRESCIDQGHQQSRIPVRRSLRGTSRRDGSICPRCLIRRCHMRDPEILEEWPTMGAERASVGAKPAINSFGV